MYFLHINVISPLPKIEETRFIAKISKATVIGITETEIDGTIFDAEIYIEVTAWFDVTDQERWMSCMLYKYDICFSIKNILSKNIEVIILDLLLPKTKPISVGVVYRPPKRTSFLQLFAETLNSLNI